VYILYTHVVAILILTSSLIILLYLFVEYSVKSTPSLFQIWCMEGISVFHSLRETGNDLS